MNAGEAGAPGTTPADGAATAAPFPGDGVLIERLLEARARVAAAAHRTPVHASDTLDRRLGARLHLKCESFQRGGSFKFRGAWNAISQLPPGVRARGVVTFSSGNHAQAVALAAQRLGIPAVIVMPSGAPAVKAAAVRDYGGEIVHHDRLGETREACAVRLARERGLALIPPFEHPDVVCGQGTAAAELLEQAGPLDLLVVPVGGGGLISGCALAAHALGAGCRVIGVEPAGGDDGVRSFASGFLQAIERARTIADGARTPMLGRANFEIIRRHVSAMTTTDDTEIVAAMRFLWERMKLVVEPTGALALSALLAGRVDAAGQRVGVVVSGGNVDVVEAGHWFEHGPPGFA